MSSAIKSFSLVVSSYFHLDSELLATICRKGSGSNAASSSHLPHLIFCALTLARQGAVDTGGRDTWYCSGGAELGCNRAFHNLAEIPA